MYTADYVGDAMAMTLPRVGGSIHDWNWLLYRMGLLGQCQTIAWGLHGIASVVVLLSVLYMLLGVFGLIMKPAHQQTADLSGRPDTYC